MIDVRGVLISDDLVETNFVCDLESCKGICCVKGDSGAPLETEECEMLEEAYPEVAPYMTEEGKEVIKKEGYFLDENGKLSTPLMKNGACAYLYQDGSGIHKCAIEKAHSEGKINFKKPVSCHLFPARVKEYDSFTAVNMQQLKICDPACELGHLLKVPTYKFLKDALIRKFGEDWYQELELLVEEE